MKLDLNVYDKDITFLLYVTSKYGIRVNSQLEIIDKVIITIVNDVRRELGMKKSLEVDDFLRSQLEEWL